MAKSLLITNQDTENLCNIVSALSGIGKDSIKEVWDATLLSMLFNLTPEKRGLQSVALPMIGKIGFKPGKSYHDPNTGKLSYDVETYLSVNNELKNIVGSIAQTGFGCITQYAKEVLLPSMVE